MLNIAHKVFTKNTSKNLKATLKQKQSAMHHGTKNDISVEIMNFAAFTDKAFCCIFKVSKSKRGYYG